MTDFLSSALLCACIAKRRRVGRRRRRSDCFKVSSDWPPESSSSSTLLLHHHRRRATQCSGPDLCVYNARDLRKRFFPQHTDRDLDYHRRIAKSAFASQDAFCSNSRNRRTGRYLRGMLPSSVSRALISRYVFANDRPLGSHDYARPKLPEIQEFFVETSDCEFVHSYLLEHRNAQFAILYLHGASGNIGYRVDVARTLFQQVPADVLLIDYRGFGVSSGTPTELGVYMDAQAGLDFLIARRASRPDLSDQRIVVMGTSLGGAVAVHLVSQEDNASLVEAAIVENCFTSVQDLTRIYCPDWAKSVIDVFGSSTMAPMFDLKEKVSSIECPLLYLVGRRDKVVPFAMTTTLLALSSNSSRKEIVEFENGDHNDLPMFPDYCSRIRDFLEHKPDRFVPDHFSISSTSSSIPFDIVINGELKDICCLPTNKSIIDEDDDEQDNHMESATAPPIPENHRHHYTGLVRQYH